MKIALLGASIKEGSIALKLQRRILERKQTLYPINPKYPEIEGIPAFVDLMSVPEVPDVVVFLVNPSISMELLDQVAHKKVKKVWFQPGSFDDAVLAKAQSLGLKINATHCMLVAPLSLVEEFVAQD